MSVVREDGWQTRPSSSPVPHWVPYPGAFSDGECAEISTMVAARPVKQAELIDGRVETAIRQTDIHWLAETPETDWVYGRLTQIVARANREVFNFALAGFEEDAQIGCYRDGGFYDWHVDRSGRGRAARSRKLGVSVLLSDPSTYAGGDLELNPDGHVVRAPRLRGTAVVFPAYTLHRVTPVTQGIRHSLVIWAHGPDFR